MGKIFVIFGKSASGKDSIFRELSKCEELNLKAIVPYTTRPIRSGETLGKEYNFVSEEKFLALKEQGIVAESRAYNTVHGIWYYFTVDDGQIDRDGYYLIIGTLRSYLSLKEYYEKKGWGGNEKGSGYFGEFVVPIYVEVENGERLMRALKREREQENPKYTEMCRRFMADEEDFSEEKLCAAGITKRFDNFDFISCFCKIKDEILQNM